MVMTAQARAGQHELNQLPQLIAQGGVQHLLRSSKRSYTQSTTLAHVCCVAHSCCSVGTIRCST